jgi:hypothetical protein
MKRDFCHSRASRTVYLSRARSGLLATAPDCGHRAGYQLQRRGQPRWPISSRTQRTSGENLRAIEHPWPSRHQRGPRQVPKNGQEEFRRRQHAWSIALNIAGKLPSKPRREERLEGRQEFSHGFSSLTPLLCTC